MESYVLFVADPTFQPLWAPQPPAGNQILGHWLLFVNLMTCPRPVILFNDARCGRSQPPGHPVRTSIFWRISLISKQSNPSVDSGQCERGRDVHQEHRHGGGSSRQVVNPGSRSFQTPRRLLTLHLVAVETTYGAQKREVVARAAKKSERENPIGHSALKSRRWSSRVQCSSRSQTEGKTVCARS